MDNVDNNLIEETTGKLIVFKLIFYKIFALNRFVFLIKIFSNLANLCKLINKVLLKTAQQ